MTRPDIEAIEARAAMATDGPWSYEPTGEKGDGANLIGIHFGPEDEDCAAPMSGRLEIIYDEQTEEFGEYYCDEYIAICEHRSRNPDGNSTFIAHARTDIPALIAYIRELEDKQS